MSTEKSAATIAALLQQAVAASLEASSLPAELKWSDIVNLIAQDARSDKDDYEA